MSLQDKNELYGFIENTLMNDFVQLASKHYNKKIPRVFSARGKIFYSASGFVSKPFCFAYSSAAEPGAQTITKSSNFS